MESTLESTPAEIKAWRKALALGAAGLAGLAPMKAKAGGWEPPGQVQTASVQNQIQALQKQIDTKFGQIDDNTKADKDFQNSMRDLTNAWNNAQNPDAKLTILQSISDYLDGQIDASTKGADKTPDAMAWEDGHQAGRAYQGAPLSPDDLPKVAKSEADPNEARNSRLLGYFIQAWIQGYKETHQVSKMDVTPDDPRSAQQILDQMSDQEIEQRAMFVSDPDGWTYMRRGPSTKDKAIAQFQNDITVEVLSRKGDWCYVLKLDGLRVANPTMGYIHKSRLTKQP
jgi:hypothetical protein